MRGWVLLLLVFSTAIAHAQPAPPAQPQGQERREKVKQRIRALRAYTLTEQLELDEATAAKLFPALSKYDDEFDKLLQTRADLQVRLDGAASIKDAKAVDKLIDDAIANQRALWETEARRLDQLRKILTPAQVARVLIVLPAMERRIQNQLRRAVKKRAAAPAGGNAGGELAKNPFAGPGEVVDPFDKRGNDKDVPSDPFDGRKAPKKAVKTCDPFGTAHGCK